MGNEIYDLETVALMIGRRYRAALRAMHQLGIKPICSPENGLKYYLTQDQVEQLRQHFKDAD